MSDRPIRRWAVPFLAVGGVLLGHAITYAGLAPAAVAREMLLAATGHAYLGTANRVGLLAAIVTLGVLVLGRIVGGHGRALTSHEVAHRLVIFQVSAFAALEVAERIGAGAPLSGLVTALPAGLLIQAAVAVAIAAFVSRLLHVADRIVAAVARETAPPAPAAYDAFPAPTWSRPILLPASVGGRAPPASR